MRTSIHYALFGIICLSAPMLKALEQKWQDPHRHIPRYFQEFPNYTWMIIVAIILSTGLGLIYRFKKAKSPRLFYVIAATGTLISYVVLGSWRSLQGSWNIQL